MTDVTIVVWSDIGCPWAHAAVSRLHRFRHELDLDDRVCIDHRAFPLELVNERPTPKRTLDAEIPVVGAIEPEAGWKLWQAEEWTWPVTTLPALEAVQAAKAQSAAASEQLDRALRVAFFAESRCVSLRSVVLDVARSCDAVDVDRLAAALDDGRARRTVVDQWRSAEGEGVKGSPHVFLPDGTDAHNPGVEMHWEGEHGEGFPVVDRDDPDVYRALLASAVAGAR
jgi:predicted DsbA family dithiol-disulfide isomerase